MNQETLTLLSFEALTKSALILAATASIDRVWQRASAAQKKVLWGGALLAVLLLPLTRMIEPLWRLPLKETTVRLPAPVLHGPDTRLAIAVEEIAYAPLPKALPHFPNWKRAVLIFWITGTTLLLLFRLLGSVRLIALRRTTSPLQNPRVQQIAASVLDGLAIARPVKIVVCPSRVVPLTWGTFRPTLMLPTSALQWGDAELEAALRHEAVHIAHGDHFMRWLATLACAVYWPNPLVWLAARRMCAAQEQAADDIVLLGGTKPEDYAAQILKVAHTLSSKRPFIRNAVAMAGPSTLERRVVSIVDASRNRRPLSKSMLAGVVLSVTFALGLATTAQVHSQTGNTPDAPSAPETAGAAAPPHGKGTLPEGPQVTIEAKFIEISGVSGEIPGCLKAQMRKSTNRLVSSIPAERHEGFFKELEKSPGVDILAAPIIIVRSGHSALVEITREMTYATDWTRNPQTGTWEAAAFATKSVGIKFRITPEAHSNGDISLLMAPEITQFEGFIDLDAPTAGSDAAKQQTNAGTAATKGGDGTTGRRSQPVFHTRKMETQTLTKAEDTVVLDLGIREEQQVIQDKVPVLGDVPLIGGLFRSTTQKRTTRRGIVLVTPRLVGKSQTSETKTGAPIALTAKTVTREKDTGVVKASGDVTINAAGTTIKTGDAEILPPAAAPETEKK